MSTSTRKKSWFTGWFSKKRKFVSPKTRKAPSSRYTSAPMQFLDKFYSRVRPENPVESSMDLMVTFDKYFKYLWETDTDITQVIVDKYSRADTSEDYKMVLQILLRIIYYLNQLPFDRFNMGSLFLKTPVYMSKMSIEFNDTTLVSMHGLEIPVIDFYKNDRNDRVGTDIYYMYYLLTSMLSSYNGDGDDNVVTAFQYLNDIFIGDSNNAPEMFVLFMYFYLKYLFNKPQKAWEQLFDIFTHHTVLDTYLLALRGLTINNRAVSISIVKNTYCLMLNLIIKKAKITKLLVRTKLLETNVGVFKVQNLAVNAYDNVQFMRSIYSSDAPFRKLYHELCDRVIEGVCEVDDVYHNRLIKDELKDSLISKRNEFAENYHKREGHPSRIAEKLGIIVVQGEEYIPTSISVFRRGSSYPKRIYTNEIDRGEKSNKLKKAVTINFLKGKTYRIDEKIDKKVIQHVITMEKNETVSFSKLEQEDIKISPGKWEPYRGSPK